jgi:hypothetical protein
MKSYQPQTPLVIAHHSGGSSVLVLGVSSLTPYRSHRLRRSYSWIECFLFMTHLGSSGRRLIFAGHISHQAPPSAASLAARVRRLVNIP